VKNTPVKALPTAHKLSEFEGQVIVLTDRALKSVQTFDRKTGEPRTSYIAQMENGEEVWIPSHVVERFEGIAGRYLVTGFDSSYGNRGFSLENAE
jgi:hypothetical protein